MLIEQVIFMHLLPPYLFFNGQSYGKRGPNALTLKYTPHGDTNAGVLQCPQEVQVLHTVQLDIPVHRCSELP